MLESLNFSGRRKLPVIMQAESAECGLACLTMISKYYGHNVDLNGLRQKFSVSLKGAPLQDLINIGSRLHLGSRAVRLELEELNKLQTPAILHWDLNHYVVLKKVKSNKAYIHDPERGLRVMSLKEVSPHFTGVALEIKPEQSFQKLNAKLKMKLSALWGKLIGLKRAIIQLFVLSVILQLITLASPFYLQLVVDEAVVKFDKKLLVVLAIGFCALTVFQTLTTMMRDWTILHFGYQLSFQMVSNIFKHLLHLPTDFFEKRHVGDILSRIGSTQPIQTALTQSLVAALIDGMMAIITGIVIFIYSPLLGVIVLLSVVLILLVTLIFYPIMRQSQEEMIVHEAKENTHQIESIRAATTIKLFSAQAQRLSIWRNLFASYINSGVAYGRYGIFQGSLQSIIGGIQSVLVIYFGAELILSGGNDFTVGMLFAFMSYRSNFTTSVTSLFNTFIEFRLLGLHLERIADIAHAKPETAHFTELAEGQDTFEGKIEFKHVSFRYSDADPWILDDISLVIEKGDFVVLVGPSGGGKTTLLKLILGLYSPTKGEILVDGVPLNDSNRLAWRKFIGVVMQDDQLLSGTIADNISFFDPQINMEKVIEAGRIAQIHDYVTSMPMKYLSLIGDMGSALSGGQRQRVLLARALYKKPIILCLDEGTANLDAETEKVIVDSVEKLQVTRIVVAHRPEFISRAKIVLHIGQNHALPV